MNEKTRKLLNDVSYVPHYELVNWSRGARIGAGVASLASLALSRFMKGPARDVTRFLAVSLGLRALLNRDLTQVIGTLISPTIRLRREIEVRAPADEVAQFWTKLENYPRFMSFVRSVKTSERGNLVWEIEGPGGVPIRWEAQIRSWWPNRTIAWVTAPGSAVFNSGTVLIHPLEYDRCKVWVELTYALRAGAFGYALARFVGFDPRARIEHDLELMKSLIEAERNRKESEYILPRTS